MRRRSGGRRSARDVEAQSLQGARDVADRVDRIGEAKRRVDVFLWFEGATRSMSGAVINEADPERLRSATLENNMNRNRENVDSKEPKLDRRSVLGLAGAAISASAASIAGSASAATQRSDIVMLDAVALSSAIHTRQFSCVEVMTAYLDHIERLNPKVNAIVALEDRGRLISLATERDAQLARGTLWGRCTGSRMR
jgi:hypothetical protein